MDNPSGADIPVSLSSGIKLLLDNSVTNFLLYQPLSVRIKAMSDLKRSESTGSVFTRVKTTVLLFTVL